jgi:hypothetical protein
MGEGKTLLLGIDLTDDCTQISMYQMSSKDTTSISMSLDGSNPLIPTCLLIKESTKDWAFGEEAQKIHSLSGGIFIDHLLARIRQDEPVVVFDTTLTPLMLLSKYFKKLLSYIRQHFLNCTIAQLIITMDDMSNKMVDAIYESLKPLGLERDRVKIISRVESFMYYILSQRQDLWANDVGLFHFDENGMIYYRLSVNRRTIPMPVVVNKINLSEEFSLSQLGEEDNDRFAFRFEKMANQLLFKRLTTSLFFTGTGFVGDWVDNTLKKLCVGRRVFKGQNLYTKGACYAAWALYYGELKEYLLLSDEMITSTIELKVYQNAKDVNYPLAKLGTPWWQVNEAITVILDSTNELELTVTNLLKREPIRETLRIDGLMERENKTVRLSIQLHYVDRETAVLTVRDTGFGQFYETTYRIWEQTLTL